MHHNHFIIIDTFIKQRRIDILYKYLLLIKNTYNTIIVFGKNTWKHVSGGSRVTFELCLRLGKSNQIRIFFNFYHFYHFEIKNLLLYTYLLIIYNIRSEHNHKILCSIYGWVQDSRGIKVQVYLKYRFYGVTIGCLKKKNIKIFFLFAFNERFWANI